MEEERTTPLRQRMIEDMRIRGMGPCRASGFVLGSNTAIACV